MKTEATEVITKASLPVTVTGMSVAGITLNEWVYILTLIYLGLQIVVIIKDKIIARRNK